MIDNNTSTDTQSLTDATGLYSFMDLDFLVLQGSLIVFLYIQYEHMVKVQSYKRFVMTPLLVMA